MDWDNLKVALAISRLGSLTQAAYYLGIDQSTAGRRLSALEADLGAILFVRSKAGFAPTDAGQAAIAKAVEVEQRVDQIQDAIAKSNEAPAGIVRLLGNAWTIERLTRTVMAPFLRAHPRLDLRTVAHVPRSFVRGEASLSLWFEVEPRDGAFAIKLGDVPYAVYRVKDIPARELGWVSFYDEDAPRPEITRSQGRLRRPDEALRMTATDAGLLLSAIRAGVGKGLVPMCLAEQYGELVRVNAGEPELKRTLQLHAHPDTVETKRVQATIQWLRESFDQVFLPDV